MVTPQHSRWQAAKTFLVLGVGLTLTSIWADAQVHPGAEAAVTSPLPTPAPATVFFVPMPCPETFPPSPTPTVGVLLPTVTPTPDAAMTEVAERLLYGDVTMLTPAWEEAIE